MRVTELDGNVVGDGAGAGGGDAGGSGKGDGAVAEVGVAKESKGLD